MVLNKKGVHWGYVLAGITGMIVIGIVFHFIFNEYFTEDDIDWEQCRQSLILRNTLPEKDLKIAVASTKGTLPVKCGTKVINIDYEDLERAEKEVAETVASCWYMYGRGEYRIFPSSVWSGSELNIPCMICARIHLDNEVREFYSEENKIDIEYSLDGPFENYDTSVWGYLNPERGSRAFMYFKNWSKDGFSIYLHEQSNFMSMLAEIPDDVEVFGFPQYFDPSRGDLFIFYAQPTVKMPLSSDFAVESYMGLIQYDNFDKLSESWVEYSSGQYAKVCSSIESVPS